MPAPWLYCSTQISSVSNGGFVCDSGKSNTWNCTEQPASKLPWWIRKFSSSGRSTIGNKYYTYWKDWRSCRTETNANANSNNVKYHGGLLQHHHQRPTVQLLERILIQPRLRLIPVQQPQEGLLPTGHCYRRRADRYCVPHWARRLQITIAATSVRHSDRRHMRYHLWRLSYWTGSAPHRIRC